MTNILQSIAETKKKKTNEQQWGVWGCLLTIKFYIRRHLRWRRFCGSGRKTARTASSKTCFSPRWVNAEHSIYFTARILFANFWPCSRFIGLKPWSARVLSVSLSSLKSIFVPEIKKKHYHLDDTQKFFHAHREVFHLNFTTFTHAKFIQIKNKHFYTFRFLFIMASELQKKKWRYG